MNVIYKKTCTLNSAKQIVAVQIRGKLTKFQGVVVAVSATRFRAERYHDGEFLSSITDQISQVGLQSCAIACEDEIRVS